MFKVEATSYKPQATTSADDRKYTNDERSHRLAELDWGDGKSAALTPGLDTGNQESGAIISSFKIFSCSVLYILSRFSL